MTAELYAEQVRAARAMLKWTQPLLAARAGVTAKIVRRIEEKNGPLGTHRHDVVAGLLRAFSEAGIYFSTEHGPGVAMRGERIPDAESNLNIFASTPADYQMGHPLPPRPGDEYPLALYVGPYLPDFLGFYADELNEQADPAAKESFRTLLTLLGASKIFKTTAGISPDPAHRQFLGREHDRLANAVHCALDGRNNPLFDAVKKIRRRPDQVNGNRLPPATTTELFRAAVATFFNGCLGAINPDPTKIELAGVNAVARDLSGLISRAAGRGNISGATIQKWGRSDDHLSLGDRKRWQSEGRALASLYGEQEAIERIKIRAWGYFTAEDPSFGLKVPETQEVLGEITKRDRSNG